MKIKNFLKFVKVFQIKKKTLNKIMQKLFHK